MPPAYNYEAAAIAAQPFRARPITDGIVERCRKAGVATDTRVSETGGKAVARL